MKILITASYHKQGLLSLAGKFGEVVYRPWKKLGRAFNEDELMVLLKDTAADALITEDDYVTAKVIAANPQLLFIGVCRGTPSNVSLETAMAMGIPVFHTPARNAQAVAEFFLARVIDLMRNIYEGVVWLKGKNLTADVCSPYLQFRGNELAGKAIGLVGFGAVGQRIASMVENFPCDIVFYDLFLERFEDRYVKTSLEELFETCEVVSIHLPVNPSTIGMIDKRLISRMKPESIFVNTAHASLVNREDLLEALEKKLIRGAVLDVFDQETLDEIDYRLINLPNVLATPGIAGATHEVEDHHVEIMNRRILQWFEKASF